MRRLSIIIVALWMLCLVGCDNKSGDSTGRPSVIEHSGDEPGAMVKLEAEAFSGELEPPMEVEEIAEASGGKVIRVEDGRGKPGEEIEGDGNRPDRFGAATYTFDIEEPGAYKVWGRTWWKDGCGNSFTLVMDGRMDRAAVLGEDGTYKHWHWVSAPKTFNLSAGKHTLEVLNREDGVKLDRLVVTSDPKLDPQDLE